MKLNTKKQIVLFLISIFIIMLHSFAYSASDEPDIASKAVLIIEPNSNKILYQKNETEKMYPASITKIMTAILTLENAQLDETVTVSYNTVMSIPEGYSSAFLQIGEQLTVEQLLQLLLVHSANDAANCLAEYVGGSVESFVSMMNTKANELGLSNTHFTNTFGMHDENHYTTAYDLAMLMKYCSQNDEFRKLAGSASCAIPATNKYQPRKYASTNELIIPDNSIYYPYLTCGKTGYTSQAGDCLVSCAFKDDLELICVILGGKTVNGVSTRFSETRELYDYAYDNYSLRTLLEGNATVTQVDVKNATNNTKNLDLIANESIQALLDNDIQIQDIPYNINLPEEIKAPIEQGAVIGNISYSIDNIEYKTDLIASHSVEKSKLLIYIIEFIIGFIILILAYKIFSSTKKNKRKSRR